MTKKEVKKEVAHLKFGLSLVERYTHKSETMKNQAVKMKIKIKDLEKTLTKKGKN